MMTALSIYVQSVTICNCPGGRKALFWCSPNKKAGRLPGFQCLLWNVVVFISRGQACARLFRRDFRTAFG